MEPLQPDAQLPALREELQILEGTRQVDGSQNWLIFDPIKHSYFQISHTYVQLLSKWSLGTPQAILDNLADLGITLENIDSLVRFLFQNSLTLHPPEGNAGYYVAQAQARKRSFLSSLIHNYLFIRIPLIRPHAFLKKTAHFTNFMFTPLWWKLIAVITLAGLYLVSRQWDAFVHTFLHFFNLKGIIFYAIALGFIKICHELGHAYAATRYGCRVTSMGIAFLVMFPVLYTDTTDSWKLPSKRKRLTIDSAGVAVELTIAAFATFLWAFLPDGPWRSAAFFLATSSWVMSLAVNLNPLMRFDGYYFFADAIGIQNLQGRGFAIGRWALREFLFAPNDPAPEALSAKMRRTLMCYSYATWVYRFFLFLGIAILVHHLFFKPLGLILFCIEIFWFIGLPILNELKVWWTNRERFFKTERFIKSAIAVGLFGLVFIVPWQSHIKIPAILEAENQTTIYPRNAGKITHINFKMGQSVDVGDILVQLHSPEIENRQHQTQQRIQLIQARLDRTVVDNQDLAQKIVLQRELKKELAQLAALDKEAASLNIIASSSGVITDAEPLLHIGRWINSDLPVVTIISKGGIRVRGYMPAHSLYRTDLEAAAVFVPDILEYKKIQGRVATISNANAETISIPALTSIFGGPIAVNESDPALKPLDAWYSMVMDLNEMPATVPGQVIRGNIMAKGERESLAKRIWRQAAKLLILETTI